MTDVVHAAGALLWREHGGKLQVLLVHRPSYDDWAWPKGKCKNGESIPDAAVREVEEETGYRVTLGRPVGIVRYRLADGRHKWSHYWAAKVPAEKGAWRKAREKVKAAPKSEIDQVQWVNARKAAKLLTYPHDREPLFQLLDAYDDDRLDTRCVAVIRHARAKKRSAHKGSEADRPLTPKLGKVESQGIAALLSDFGVNTVISSPWERCVASVAPYAKKAGIKLATEDVLTEKAHEKNPQAAADLMRRVLAEGHDSVALCTHRPVLKSLVAELLEHAPNRLSDEFPRQDPWLRFAEILVLHVAPHRKRGVIIADVERHRPAT